MSLFNCCFTELFKLKTKKLNTLMLFQILTSMAITFFSLYKFENNHFIRNTYVNDFNFITNWMTSFFFLVLAFGFIAVCLIAIFAQRVNRSQTWRLIPMSSTNLYLDNTLSSFVSIVYLGILDVIGLLLLFGMSVLTDSRFKKDVITGFSSPSNAMSQLFNERAFKIWGSILLLILITLFVFFVVDFLNFSSRAILEFLPTTSGQGFLRVIFIIVLILACWVAVSANSFLASLIDFPIDFVFSSVLGIFGGYREYNDRYVDFGISLIIMLVFDIFLLIANTLIFNYFFEAREKK